MADLQSRSLWNIAAAGALILTTTACLNMDVTNPNEPDRGRALNQPGDVETLIAGTFRTWWDQNHGRGDELAMGLALSQSAEVHVSGSANDFTGDLGQQPRIPVINQIGYQWARSLRGPWMELNRANAAIRDGLLVIEDGLEIGPGGQDTPRAVAFAKLMQGLGHGFIAKLFDKGFIIDETIDPVDMVEQGDLRSYQEVMVAARGYLAEARQLASQHTFTISESWLGRSVSNQELVRMINSWESRFMTAVARTPEERAQVDWEEVLRLAEQGVTSDYGIATEPGGVWSSSYNGPLDLAVRFLGPADQSGGWQAYEQAFPRERQPFRVETDDQRIHAPGDPQASGTLVEIPGTTLGDAQRGIWFVTPYRTWKFRDLSDTGFGFLPELRPREMEFLRAEAHIRLGQPELALPYINESRVEAGLPPATVDGVSGDRCVPRTITGECGDLLLTLLYEKQLELLFETAGLDYYDQRGFGTLREGTPLHFPVVAEELETLGLPVYTFGGPGGESAAPGRRSLGM